MKQVKRFIQIWTCRKRDIQAAHSLQLKATHNTSFFRNIQVYPVYSVWWQLSDMDRSILRQCEVMVKILCHCTRLKGENCRLIKGTIGARMCILCELAAEENARHMIMQCPFHTVRRNSMHSDISRICPVFGNMDVCNILLGKAIDDMNPENMVQIWRISCYHISKMYWDTISKRTEYETA